MKNAPRSRNKLEATKPTVAREGVEMGKKTVTDHKAVTVDWTDEEIVIDRNAESKQKRC